MIIAAWIESDGDEFQLLIRVIYEEKLQSLYPRGATPFL